LQLAQPLGELVTQVAMQYAYERVQLIADLELQRLNPPRRLPVLR
jgi:hypothetical protein